MKFKVGDEVLIQYPESTYHGKKGLIQATSPDFPEMYAVYIYSTSETKDCLEVFLVQAEKYFEYLDLEI